MRLNARQTYSEWNAIFAQVAARAENIEGTAVRTDCGEAAGKTRKPTRSASTALLVADAALRHRSLSKGLASLGRRCITVRHPRDVFTGLRQGSLAIDAVFAPVQDPHFSAREFFTTMRDDFPLVRRIAHAMHASQHACALDAGLLEVVLTYPTPQHELAEALQPAPPETLFSATPRAQPPLRRDPRSDQQLLQALKGSDRGAFDELYRRYRPRIRQLAISMRFSDEDTEEIVQETLLALLAGRRSLRGDRTADRYICGLAATSVLARLRGEQRLKRLRLALAQVAGTDRTEREHSGQPDAGLQSSELTDHVDAAICNLPAWCRPAFWLRVVEGKSAKEASAALDLLPSTVDAWLQHARKHIAHELHSSRS